MFCVTDPHLALLLAGVDETFPDGRPREGAWAAPRGREDRSEDWALLASLSIPALLLGLALLAR